MDFKKYIKILKAGPKKMAKATQSAVKDHMYHFRSTMQNNMTNHFHMSKYKSYHKRAVKFDFEGKGFNSIGTVYLTQKKNEPANYIWKLEEGGIDPDAKQIPTKAVMNEGEGFGPRSKKITQKKSVKSKDFINIRGISDKQLFGVAIQRAKKEKKPQYIKTTKGIFEVKGVRKTKITLLSTPNQINANLPKKSIMQKELKTFESKYNIMDKVLKHVY